MVAKKTRAPVVPAPPLPPTPAEALTYIYLTVQELEGLASLTRDEVLTELLRAVRNRAGRSLQPKESVRRLKRRPGEGGEAAGQ
ncbi:MAG: hypothetical protein JNJ73_21690 [Hyphomonadaceae bacterium]|nr:hypothetical protein [Hyphomonadaceae bacterium]